MSMTDRKIQEGFLSAIKDTGRGTKPYDTTAKVTRIEGQTAWVHIPGGVAETPVRMSLNARVGDDVNIRISGGRAFLTGNLTSPPTDDKTANEAQKTASEASTDAAAARLAAVSAQTYAVQAQVSAEQAIEDAESANSAAKQASEDAKTANESAISAGKAASAAQAAAEATQGEIKEQKNYFWHDSLGTHVLSEQSGCRTDTDATGMKVVDIANQKTIADFGKDGITYASEIPLKIGNETAYIKYFDSNGDGKADSLLISGAEVVLQSGQSAESAIEEVSQKAEYARNIANSKNSVYYNDIKPSGGVYAVNDIWFDTGNGNAMYFWNGSDWIQKPFGSVAIADGAILAEKIASKAVTAVKIDTADLFAQDITASGTIHGLKLIGGSLSGKNDITAYQVYRLFVPAGQTDSFNGTKTIIAVGGTFDGPTVRFGTDDATTELAGDVFVGDMANGVPGNIRAANFTGNLEGEWDNKAIGPVNKGGSWPFVPVVHTDGVMEIGKYIDFHAADNAFSEDYSVRLTASNGNVACSGSMSATNFSGPWSGVAADFNTENRSDTWIPVFNSGKMQHTNPEVILKLANGVVYTNQKKTGLSISIKAHGYAKISSYIPTIGGWTLYAYSVRSIGTNGVNVCHPGMNSPYIVNTGSTAAKITELDFACFWHRNS